MQVQEVVTFEGADIKVSIWFGENIRRHPMSPTSLECRVSELASSDTCPRPAAKDIRVFLPNTKAAGLSPEQRVELRSAQAEAVRRGRVPLLNNAALPSSILRNAICPETFCSANVS